MHFCQLHCRMPLPTIKHVPGPFSLCSFLTDRYERFSLIRLLRSSCLVALLVGLAGCASVDFDYPKTQSYALNDTDETYLGQLIEGRAEDHPGESGFHSCQKGKSPDADAVGPRSGRFGGV